MIQTLFRVYLVMTFSEFAKTSAGHFLSRAKRVVGGNLINIEEIPYLVNIRRKGVFECGGSLITPKCVITAAHCIKSGKPKDFVVRAGVTYLDEVKNSRRVEDIFVHTSYDNKSLDHDVAVFKLMFPFKNIYIETIQLATEIPAVGEYVQISGWGLTNELSAQPSNQLRTINVSILSHSHCRKLYKDYRNITSNMFCAAGPGLRDACSADSGGPAISKNKIVGIVSWGKNNECARNSSPGVYVNVPELRHWIDRVVRQSCH